jgi:hypothetical protein
MVVDRPGLQIQLAEEILKLGKPTILVLIHGGAMSLGPLKEKYTAIVDAFYGGEMGGENPFKPAYRFIFVSCCFLLFPAVSCSSACKRATYFCIAACC